VAVMVAILFFSGYVIFLFILLLCVVKSGKEAEENFNNRKDG